MVWRNIMYMSTAAFDHVPRLRSALDRQGSSMSVDEFLNVLRQVAAPESEALTAGERDFLLETTDLTEDDLTPDAYETARLRVAEDQALAEDEAVAASLTTSQVANLLGRQGPSIRRSKGNGGLYALPTVRGRETLYPAWQFVGGEVVPGLSEIISKFPQYMHPLDVQDFMTEPHEELDGRSPAQWLTDGGSVAAVVSLVDELSYE